MDRKGTNMTIVRRMILLLSDFRVLVALAVALVIYFVRFWPNNSAFDYARFTYEITRTWDDQPTGHDPIQISLLPNGDTGIKVKVEGPFFGDPPNPGGEPGQTFPGLWEYEVAEVFFLNHANQYLEVELCPHGQHLVLLLSDYRKSFKDGLPLEFQASISGNRWQGEAIIPAEYFPKDVTKMNAYAIHGSGNKRTYETLYPVPKGKYENPDFHRLDYFQPVAMTELLPSNTGDKYKSTLWSKVMSS